MEKLITYRTLQGLQQLKDYLKEFEYISWDTETTGVDKDARIIGFSVSAETGVGYYVILSYWDVESQEMKDLETLAGAKDFFEFLSTKKLVAHNAVFDCAMVENNFQVSLIDSMHTDTMVLSHLLDENRHNGLKELGVSIFGDNARAEQAAMKASVTKNGGTLTADKYELYKADADLMALYGAKDALLTNNLFNHFIPQLFEQGLDTFFYDEESMPLLKSATYDLNTVGLRVDTEKLQELKGKLEVECMELHANIYKEITPHVKDKYPGTSKAKTFNVGAPQQLSWLLFSRLGNEFGTLTDSGREICKALNLKPPYSAKAKREFIIAVKENKGKEYADGAFNPKTGKVSKPKVIGDFWKYLSADKDTLEKLSARYNWVGMYLKYASNKKLLSTYIGGIQERMRYSVINPSFLQIGTTSGRYSSKQPNFQNLPRDDKRIKECIISRPGKVFIGADYSQLEPRVFASVSQDPTLMACFEKGEDFYSVVGIPIFGKTDCSPYKKDPNSFAEKHPELRQIAKAFALATPYGTSAFRQSSELGMPVQECQDIIDKYFEAYPRVELMMLQKHQEAKDTGLSYSLYGRPRRLPEAKEISSLYGPATPHGELPYAARTLLNLGMNHSVQSSAASIVNRAAIAFKKRTKDMDVKIVLQVHDELVVECAEGISKQVADILKDCMENTTVLPGVKLVAQPVIANNLAGLK